MRDYLIEYGDKSFNNIALGTIYHIYSMEAEKMDVITVPGEISAISTHLCKPVKNQGEAVRLTAGTQSTV